MLATLVVISALFQFALSARLSLFRRILTPAVAGTVLMLIAVTVMPIVFGMLKDVPDGTPAPAAPLSALVTLLVIIGIGLKATGMLRLWAPVIGVVTGSVVAGFFGLYDIGLVADASWIGLPKGAWPGFDLNFGPVFWALLPAFVFVTLVGAIETVGDAVAIQHVSWRQPRAVDFRAVQGAVAADGVGNLLSGLAGTVPNTTYSSSISIAELTGVGARSVGIAVGAIFLALAFLPKALAVVLAIPGPVAAAYLTVLLAMLFVVGMKVVFHDGIDYRKGLIAGVAFWVGVGFQNGVIFPEYFSEFARRAATQRYDGRWSRGHPHDPVRRVDGLPPQPGRGGIRHFGPAEDQRVSPCIRSPRWVGHGDGRPPRCRRRGGFADTHPG